jgi:Helix-turn-helix domain
MHHPQAFTPYRNGEEVGSYRVELVSLRKILEVLQWDVIVVRYTYGGSERMAERIEIDSTPCNYGGWLPVSFAGSKAAILKDRLAFLLDTRFRPSAPESPPRPGLTVEEVADRLHCRCRTVLRMIRRGDLRPFNGEDGELYFDPAEVAGIKAVPMVRVLLQLLSRR